MIVISGFGPFDKYKINPSWEAAKEIDVERKFLIPVTYREAKEYAKKIIDLNPDIVVALGLSPSSKKFRVEMLGINVMYASIPDNEGVIAQGEKLFEDGKNCYISNVPVFELVSYLNSEGFPAVPSFSAGTYICNALYYSLLYYREKKRSEAKIIFVHVPPSKEIKDDGWKMEDIKLGVKKVIEFTSRLSSL